MRRRSPSCLFPLRAPARADVTPQIHPRAPAICAVTYPGTSKSGGSQPGGVTGRHPHERPARPLHRADLTAFAADLLPRARVRAMCPKTTAHFPAEFRLERSVPAEVGRSISPWRASGSPCFCRAWPDHGKLTPMARRGKGDHKSGSRFRASQSSGVRGVAWSLA